MRRRKNKALKVWNKMVLFLVIGFLIYLGYQMFGKKIDFSSLFSKASDTKEENKDNSNDNDNPNKNNPNPEIKPDPKLKIIDLDSKSRSVAFMVDNERGAWPQAGLQNAYIVYEILIEGGETRFLAVFKDKTTTTVGPNRSARHYYIDYALENDAVFVHYGFSPQAQSDIKTLKINDISGTQSDGSAFWRQSGTSGWHNVFTTVKNVLARAVRKGYRLSSTQPTILNYSISNIDLSDYSNAIEANDIKIVYSNTHYVTYVYDSVNKIYKRYQRGVAHTDRNTKLQYTVKNIIVYSVKNYNLNDGSGKGRQGLNNIGSGSGYYISNGYAIPITWGKSSRSYKNCN